MRDLDRSAWGSPSAARQQRITRTGRSHIGVQPQILVGKPYSDGFERGAVVQSGCDFAEDNTQGSLWEDRVVLDEVFFARYEITPCPCSRRRSVSSVTARCHLISTSG